jgi:hypothetical protein
MQSEKLTLKTAYTFLHIIIIHPGVKYGCQFYGSGRYKIPYSGTTNLKICLPGRLTCRSTGKGYINDVMNPSYRYSSTRTNTDRVIDSNSVDP